MLTEKLLEIKIDRKHLVTKSVYVANSTSDGDWAYFVYYYDLFSHSFYINDLDNLCNNTRTKAVNIIEHIVKEAYNQEMYALTPIVRDIQMRKKPQVFCIYRQAKDKDVLIDKITFKFWKSLRWRIVDFKNPRWEDLLEDTLRKLGVK
jgi:hypothetical protein